MIAWFNRLNWKSLLLLWGFLLLAWLVRHGIALWYWGHWGDMVTFKSWALRMATFGPNRFFLLEPGQPPGIPCDYPPLYPYLLGLVGELYRIFGDGLRPEQSGLFTLLIKYPAILVELAGGWLVFHLIRSHGSRAAALTGLLLYWFNPAMMLDTAGAGQVNPFISVLQLAALAACLRKQYGWAILVTALAILCKPQGLILAPLIGFMAVRNHAWRQIAWSVPVSLLMALAITAPYLWGKVNVLGMLPWLWDHYLAQANMYPFSSAMAFNLWAPFGYWDQRDDRMLWGLSHRSWGLFLFATAYLGVLVGVWRRRDPESLWQFASLAMLAFFLFPTRMHERYLYYALVLMSLVAATRPAWRIALAWYSFSFVANLSYVLHWPLGSHFHAWLEDGGDLWLAGINVLIFGYCALLAIGAPRPTIRAVDRSSMEV